MTNIDLAYEIAKCHNTQHHPDGEPEDKKLAAKDRKNAARRARHQAMLDLGLKRVKGALGGVYYE